MKAVSFHGRINYSTTLDGDISNFNQFRYKGLGMYIQGSEIKFADGGYIRVSNPKLEIGNRATDWTPAPEDVESATAAAQSTADTAVTNASAAQSAADAAQSTAGTAKKAANKAQSTADAAQSTADTAKTNAATAQSTADNAKKAANKAQSAVDNIDNGGNNLLRNSSTLDFDDYSFTASSVSSGESPLQTVKGKTITSTTVGEPGKVQTAHGIETSETIETFFVDDGTDIKRATIPTVKQALKHMELDIDSDDDLILRIYE
jgi:hypothetical protein